MPRRSPGESASRWLERLPSGVEADVREVRERWQTMRYANGRITQPHVEDQGLLSLRVLIDGRLATATSNDLTPDGFDRLARQAIALARSAPPEPKFPGFPGEAVRPPVRASTHRATPLSPETVGRLAMAAMDAVRQELPDARISGAVHVGVERVAVANTSGLDRAMMRTIGQASALAEDLSLQPAGSGWAECAEWDPRRLPTARMGREAAARVARVAPRRVPPGRYPVLLRSPAVSELLAFLGYLGFSAHGELEGWSCLAKQRDRTVAPESVSLTDDGTSPRVLPQTIDFEGVGKRPIPLIENGVARGPVLDLLSAGRLGRETTGHGPPPESPYGDAGPSPGHLLLAPGDAREEEMIRSIRRGILVTRFHYVRVVHSARSILTGMTRDGTYWIENGEVTAPVRNLRFTESVLGTLGGVELVGRAAERTADERGALSVSCPPLVSRSFRFTSATVF
ncbi:MAG TPA: TldD/PmbA family protein [Thermoplasmata archaeon]|nr:TldD/PmbA family protein [Thermoplasmata archaeon]